VEQYSIDDDGFSGTEDGNLPLPNGDTDFMNPTASRKRRRKRPTIYSNDGGENENRIAHSQQIKNRTRIKNTTERWFLLILFFMLFFKD
jgi:hypothetical protein